MLGINVDYSDVTFILLRR